VSIRRDRRHTTKERHARHAPRLRTAQLGQPLTLRRVVARHFKAKANIPNDAPTKS
jgi:hypothetical protein